MSSINKTARLAGILYLLLGGLSTVGMPAYFIRPATVTIVAGKLLLSEMAFRLSIVSALLAAIINVFVVLALYILLKPVGRRMALLMVIFILVEVPIAMLNELCRIAALLLSEDPGYLKAFNSDQLHSLVLFLLELHRQGITIAGLFWGLWLFPMGYLVFKSGYIPRILGILLMLGCFAYLTNSMAVLFSINNKTNIVIFVAWGEVLFPLWLLIKGVNVGRWEKWVHPNESVV